MAKRGQSSEIRETSVASYAMYSGFERSFLDFKRGIRVGRLEPEQRVTQILKGLLWSRFHVDMICDKWGRGVYWQWICWVPRPNRDAKPESNKYNFASSKFFISIERDEKQFQAGFQLERAPTLAGADDWGVQIKKDWDWHVLLKQLKSRSFSTELKKLMKEGFRVKTGPFSSMLEFDEKTWSPDECLRCARLRASKEWGAFQLFWSMPEKEIKTMSGPEIIEAVMAIFDEVAPAMNSCMYQGCLILPAAED